MYARIGASLSMMAPRQALKSFQNPTILDSRKRVQTHATRTRHQKYIHNRRVAKCSRVSGDHQHLRVMEKAGLVRSAPHGRESVWHVEQKRLADARRHLHMISAQWDETL